MTALLTRDGTFMAASCWFLRLLASLHDRDGFTEAEFGEVLKAVAPELDPPLVLSQLYAAGFLKHEDPTSPARPDDWNWERYGWGVAKLFHAATVDTAFAQGDADGWKQQEKSFAAISTEGTGPPMVKDYSDRPTVRLSDPVAVPFRPFFEILMGRRTCRSFNPTKRSSKDQLSTLLHFAARAHGTVRHGFFGPHMLRTSPSGGARHPVEIYPQLLRVEDIRTGSYYYNPLEHSLAELGSVQEPDLYLMGQRQDGCRHMALAFIITARFERNLWKYRYSKSYAFTWLDVGHFVQTLVLSCEAVGLKCFITPALDVKLACQHLSLPNCFDECPLYLVTAG